MKDNVSRNRKVALVAAIIIVILGVIFIVQTRHSTPPATVAKTEVTSYEGTDSLLSVGASSAAITNLQFAVHKYLIQTGTPISQKITITNVEHNHDEATANDSYTFQMTLKSETYSAVLTVEALSPNQAELTLSDITGQQVFDSGIVNANSTTDSN